MNPDLNQLQPYPFQKLVQLIQNLRPPADKEPIALSLGEPKHKTPGFITEELLKHLQGLAKYPLTLGNKVLRQSIATWLKNRFKLPPDSIDAERHILPVNGTREALFAFAQCVVDRSLNPWVVMPNPFYQIYEGAAILAGAKPYYVNCTRENNYSPDFDAVPPAVWSRCELLYLCTPGNPTGAVISEQSLQMLIELAERYEFVIASDECYSEIYFDENQPPPGLLGSAMRMGNSDYKHCLVFHSLSKRSNVPGLRSGFIAGDATIVAQFLKYRTYHGCAMPLPTQAASAIAWQDENHVTNNRQLYRQKFYEVMEILSECLDLERPAGGFYLWARTPIDDKAFASQLYAQQHVTVLPGCYLSRQANGVNPGRDHIRMALVAPLEECAEAAQRIVEFMRSL